MNKTVSIKRGKPEEKVPCPICRQLFKKNGLETHMQRAHGFKPKEK